MEDVGQNVPSGSGTSLTPPPPTSDDIPVEQDHTEPSDEADGEDWTAYRRKHGVRGFGKAKTEDEDGDVKMEVDEDDDETPGKNRKEMSDGQGTPTLRNRKRRGEEQLLLDDHLLPEEMRRTGKLTGKRGRDGEEIRKEDDVDFAEIYRNIRNVQVEEDGVLPENEDEELTKEDEEEEKADLPTTDQEEEEVQQEDEEEDIGDADDSEATRCVCERDSEYPVTVDS